MDSLIATRAQIAKIIILQKQQYVMAAGVSSVVSAPLPAEVPPMPPPLPPPLQENISGIELKEQEEQE